MLLPIDPNIRHRGKRDALIPAAPTVSPSPGRLSARLVSVSQKSGKLERAVVVAVIAVGKVQVSIHEVADVIAVRDRLVTAARTMNVSFLVTGARVAWGASHGIRL